MSFLGDLNTRLENYQQRQHRVLSAVKGQVKRRQAFAALGVGACPVREKSLHDLQVVPQAGVVKGGPPGGALLLHVSTVEQQNLHTPRLSLPARMVEQRELRLALANNHVCLRAVVEEGLNDVRLVVDARCV